MVWFLLIVVSSFEAADIFLSYYSSQIKVNITVGEH